MIKIPLISELAEKMIEKRSGKKKRNASRLPFIL